MTRVLVPVEVLEGGSVSPGLVALLEPVDVTVLGYHVLPEQTPPDQARLQFEDRATAALEDLAGEFRTGGGAADYRLVFTHDREETIERVAEDVDARAFAMTGMAGDVDRILVSLSGESPVEGILEFVTELVGDRDVGVTLLLAAEEESAGEAERLETAVERLRAEGLNAKAADAAGTSPFDALVDEAPDHDAIVMSERAPSLRSFVFGDETDRVASASAGPVLVVRHDETIDE